MTLWHWTFAFLFLTAIVGLVLFSGFTLRISIRYPLILVATHVASASTTFILFTILLVHRLTSTQTGVQVFVLISYMVLVVTFVSGIYFFFRYDAQRKRMRYFLLLFHLMSASLTFIFVISSLAAFRVPHPHSQQYTPGGAMYNVHKHHTIHQRGHKTSQGSTNAANGSTAAAANNDANVSVTGAVLDSVDG
ncbi:hypothetical protein [Alicyclobacillus sp. SO9]|uniref:hypothetical protein n=1 Tax=Alicyclobacillus sp. SO9 TaxID=2665646 RepID=UPI0018E84471|nr:hypothetical protein [Alicyclobacillus sp. SO9]QQE77703.1 hypothetical protein GI364_17445 [Alicyclobacillus sp. SO9]